VVGHLARRRRPGHEIADQAAVEIEVVVKVNADLVADVGVGAVGAGADGRDVVRLQRVDQLAAAVEHDPRATGVPSTKGVL